MKRIALINATALGAAAMLLAVGCKTQKPVGLTTIPGQKTIVASNPNPLPVPTPTGGGGIPGGTTIPGGGGLPSVNPNPSSSPSTQTTRVCSTSRAKGLPVRKWKTARRLRR